MHLLLPLLASFLFVASLVCVKRVANPRSGRGAGAITVLFFSNVVLALAFSFLWRSSDDVDAQANVWQPLTLSLFYVLGVLFTFAAIHGGDISVATPVLAVKIILVAMMLSTIAAQPVGTSVWIASVLAAIGVALIQWTGRAEPRHMLRTICLALLAASFYAGFDVLNQMWSPQWGGGRLLPITFWGVGLLSLLLTPWVDWPALRNREVAIWLTWTCVLTLAHTLLIVLVIAYFGDAARVNIILSLRGMWSIGLAYVASGVMRSNEATLAPAALRTRLAGAGMLTLAVVAAIAT